MAEFIPGLKLSELFYQEAVKPILAADFPGLIYSAVLLGYGSEVLGFDTPQSTDHAWGPRLYLFLNKADFERLVAPINTALSQQLPHRFYGYSTSFSPDEEGIPLLEETESGPVKHLVTITTVSAFFEDYLGLDPSKELEVIDWLVIPEQKLRTITAGKVFHDGPGDLTIIRQKLAYYPHDIWLLLLAAQWTRIEQEAPFMGRGGDVGDELGSQVIAARLVREIMKLCFLMERQYAPYSKWFGTAFARLKCAAQLSPLLQQTISTSGWKEREKLLSAAYELVARMHNALGITRPLETTVAQFYDRPYLVLKSSFSREIVQVITSETVKRVLIPGVKYAIGNIDQLVDSTDILSDTTLCVKLKALYL